MAQSIPAQSLAFCRCLTPQNTPQTHSHSHTPPQCSHTPPHVTCPMFACCACWGWGRRHQAVCHSSAGCAAWPWNDWGWCKCAWTRFTPRAAWLAAPVPLLMAPPTLTTAITAAAGPLGSPQPRGSLGTAADAERGSARLLAAEQGQSCPLVAGCGGQITAKGLLPAALQPNSWWTKMAR
jgi:hypothetical protein